MESMGEQECQRSSSLQSVSHIPRNPGSLDIQLELSIIQVNDSSGRSWYGYDRNLSYHGSSRHSGLVLASASAVLSRTTVHFHTEVP